MTSVACRRNLPPVITRCSGAHDMAMPKYDSVDAYIAAQPPAARRWIKAARAAIRKAVPRAEESISYGIPAYKLDGRVLIYVAAWKAHYSIYPSTAPLVAAFKRELALYEIDKGTIRFPLDQAAPADLIRRMAAFRAGEIDARRPAA